MVTTKWRQQQRQRESMTSDFSDKDTDEKREFNHVDEAKEDTMVEYTPVEERKLVWKLDLILIPFAMMLYMSAYLDRGNLGNARLMGLESDTLENSDTNYSIALVCFYISYIVFAIPGTLASKYMLPSTSLAIGCALWSIAATCMAATFNPAGVFVCRLFVGLGEAMFGQAVALLFSFWYTKPELAKRVGIFISAGSLAGAFGGLIAFGINSIPNAKIHQWRVLFLIEGLPGLILAAAVYLYLPTYPDAKSRYLSDRDREVAAARMAKESTNEGHNGIDKRALKRAFSDWKVYVVAFMYMSMNVNLSSVGGFLPTIVKGLGYTAARAQLFTVPPYAVALAVTVIVSTISDRLQSRGVPLALTYCIGVAGWGILLGLDAASKSSSVLGARYFGVICVVAPAYATIPLQLSWVASNSPAQTQRAVALGMLNTIGQCGSIVGSFIFPSKEGPQYIPGVAVNIAFQCFGATVAILMTLYYRFENGRRDRLEGGRPEDSSNLNVQEDFDRAKGFRHTSTVAGKSYEFKTYGEYTVADLSAGHYCANGPDFAAQGFKAGDKATLIVVYQADGSPGKGFNKRWNFQCADVKLVDNWNQPEGFMCGNYYATNETHVKAADKAMEFTISPSLQPNAGQGGRPAAVLAKMEPSKASGIGAGVTAGVFLLAIGALWATGFMRFGRKKSVAIRDDASSASSVSIKQVRN
ncbi:hypothetical protein CcaverHIS631_0500110 [Cutaneotrichosporon cavernicola]|nr:hypothetical protein CcaverHIS631_0500110 [Cutaneotrichosporon cavernicola]BEJ07926.1 hypothetical protein CcaverHIS641_0500110 [Cutaneotrichosporon cavernicola]